MVLVGTTGTGKTTCLNIYTGQVVMIIVVMVYHDYDDNGENSYDHCGYEDNHEEDHHQNLETGKSLTTKRVAVDDMIIM